MEFIGDEESTTKRKFSQKRRPESLLDSINAGVCACQGCRSSMEDVHRMILWSGIRRDQLTKEDVEDQPAKRMKTTLSENVTSTEDDDNQTKSRLNQNYSAHFLLL